MALIMLSSRLVRSRTGSALNLYSLNSCSARVSGASARTVTHAGGHDLASAKCHGRDGNGEHRQSLCSPTPGGGPYSVRVIRFVEFRAVFGQCAPHYAI